MTHVTITTKTCPYWIPTNTRVSNETIQTFFKTEKTIRKTIKNRGPYLEKLLYDLRTNLKKIDSAIWLRENRNELREAVYLVPDLDVLSTDSDEVRNAKLTIGAQLIEVIEA